MIVLGVDTGTEKTGWVLFDTEKFSILDKGIDDNKDLVEKFKTLEYDEVVLEMVASYGMPVGKTTFETCVWIGRFIQVFEDRGKPNTKYYKKMDINPTICGSNKAKDSNIRQALLDMFPPKGGGKTPQVGTKKEQGDLYGVSSHMWAALAVAISYSLNNSYIQRRYF